MEYDDLADLLHEMPLQQRTAILAAMDDEEAEVVSRLLSYEEATAGGMLTPEIIILGPDDTVAEALAQFRDPDWTPSIASQVFICQSPLRPPTGRYLGVVFMQRLLREPPSMELSRCVDQVASVRPDTPDREVFEEFASYDMLAMPVLDEAGTTARSGECRRRRRPHAGLRMAAALAPAARRHPIGGDDMKRRSDLSQPRRRGRIAVSYDAELFGQFSESIARFIGTARFLVWQTVIIIVWLAANILPPEKYQFDPWDRGLVLLTLVLSLQAAYAAPLILLAQNRQERRDRVASEQDRDVAERTQADTEFLAREIASVRFALSDVVTGEEMRDELSGVVEALERLNARLDDLHAARPA